LILQRKRDMSTVIISLVAVGVSVLITIYLLEFKGLSRHVEQFRQWLRDRRYAAKIKRSDRAGYFWGSSRVHFNNGGKPLCNHRGISISLNLCSREVFEKEKWQCCLCKKMLGIGDPWAHVRPISDRQRELLIRIYNETDGSAEDKWCYMKDLLKDSGYSDINVLRSSVGSLQRRGLVMKQHDKRGHILVRLTDKVCIDLTYGGRQIVLN
jgi:hypothetical protein